MKLAQRIKKSREYAGFTKADVASRIGVSSSATVQWESSSPSATKPSLDNLSKLAVLFNVSFEWLATGRGNMEYQDVPNKKLSGNQPFMLDKSEQEYLKLLRGLKSQTREAVIKLLKSV